MGQLTKPFALGLVTQVRAKREFMNLSHPGSKERIAFLAAHKAAVFQLLWQTLWHIEDPPHQAAQAICDCFDLLG